MFTYLGFSSQDLESKILNYKEVEGQDKSIHLDSACTQDTYLRVQTGSVSLACKLKSELSISLQMYG